MPTRRRRSSPSPPTPTSGSPTRSAERRAEADDGYVGESSDAGCVDEAEEGGDSDNVDGGRRVRGGRRPIGRGNRRMCMPLSDIRSICTIMSGKKIPCVRLDGATSINKRQKLVNQFIDLSREEFVFLLSSKAGGCGLNLVGGNRLVLFGPDWNPANDKQLLLEYGEMDKKKRVYIYRFLSTGTIEEKVYQPQMSKEGLRQVIQQEQGNNKVQVQGVFFQQKICVIFLLSMNKSGEFCSSV